ncbi:MAG: hypothetical protein CGU28_14980 [Candidatus Dactylopiibacterium carminicum]|uniref:Motility protein n=1 Tax=Candidatus Dactylopiibacterium carminicum TaxID=857335 RepID=A0A272ENF7_9RHOO|nr:hypothetical protein [Candidatus Dactylopiibacterium carminicum]KAF7598070.1 hypothetical protein BGI27_15315 [Candidatus Dactylopiibacterium carminicum]PAS91631.1 MAG: hypothetical protein CGU29_15350 [Candidatus Dactylopiibacterium carminicum]PAS93609.1 MAG: hypothetical protein CGU28_14980 [Candidatus Dactylopiibacterium carminicum]PAS96512.1 MAG: hypothetical protein BSR46_15360 [Candidatus Dactylopiibacterium carminicum]
MSSTSAVSNASAQSQVQLEVLRRATEVQSDQALQLLQAQAEAVVQAQQEQAPQPVTPGQPGGVINTFA